MRYDIFISYSRKDAEIANKIYEVLTSAGLSCFIDLDGISGGADFPTVLAQAIMESKVMLLVASRNFYASEYAMKEVTFAVNNKGSHFILPIIIERSELPKNLEFILSNINWRELSRSYRIEHELLADVKDKLVNPHAGETLKQQSKHKVRVMNRVFLIALVLCLAVLLYLIVPGSLENRKREREKNLAVNSSQTCFQSIIQASTLLQRVDSLRKDTEEQDDTFYTELALMKEAEEYVNQSDSILRIYASQPAYAYLFSGLNTRAKELHSSINSQRDSMTSFWKEFAMSNYRVFLDSRDSLDFVIAQEYVNKAYSLAPEDPDLSNIYEALVRP